MCPRLAQQQLQEQQQAARDSFFLRKIKNKSKMLWNSERTRKMVSMPFFPSPLLFSSIVI